MATDVIYNGVTLKNVDTRQWSETVRYDSTNTDAIGKTYDLIFDAVVHLQGLFTEGGAFSPTAPTYVSNGQDWNQPPSALRGLLQKLQQPRKNLIVTMGGTTVVNVTPPQRITVNPLANDIDNGPKPISVDVFRIGGNKTFRVRFHVQATVNNCEASGGNVGVTVNNRWSVLESMDEDFAIHRTVTGSLKLNIAPAAGNQMDPLAYRHLTVPPLESGFRRAGISFQGSTDGLSLNYEITDRQSYYAPPWPASRIKGSHTEQTIDGYKFMASCMCRLTGAPHVSVKDLIARAIQFTQYRINWQRNLDGDTNGNAVRITNAYIKEDIGDTPTVEVGVSLMLTLGENTSSLAKIRSEKWGGTDFGYLTYAGTRENTGNVQTQYEINQHPNPWIFGYNTRDLPRSAASSFFLRCVLQGQCGSSASLQSPSTGSPAENDGPERQTTVVTEYEETDQLNDPNPTTTWSDEHLDAMYLQVRQSNVYTWDNVHAQLPVAGSPSNGRTASIVKLSNQTSKRRMMVDYERFGKPPVIPNMENATIGRANLTIVAAKVEPLAPTLSEDGEGIVYRTRANYLYYSDRVLSTSDEFPVGRLPAIATEHAGNELLLYPTTGSDF